MEKRRSQRMDALNTMKGKLFNVVNFLVVNISQDGLHLVSSFQPTLGATYKIFLFNTNAGSQQDFEIEINRAQVQAYDEKKHIALTPGLLYAIGAKFINQNKKRQEFLAFFLQNKSLDSEQGYIARDTIKTKT